MRFLTFVNPFGHAYKAHLSVIHISRRLFGQKISSFDEAKSALNSLKNEVDNDVKLRIYALFKQATVGDCISQKPGMLNLVEKAKWQAWDSLRSTPKEEAASKYVELVSDLVSKEEAAISTHKSTDSYDDLEVTLNQEGIMQLCLNRPHKKNAITPEMYMKWTKTLNDAATNPNVKLVSVTGKGDYFSSGNDLNTFAESIAGGASITEVARDAREVLRQFVSAFIDLPKPLIGLVNGPAVGITVTTLGLYDYVLASDTATFHTPFVALGQSPEGCSSFTFPRQLGPLMANEMLLFGRKLTAHEACVAGLVTRVVPIGDFPLECDKLMSEIAQLPSQSLFFSKEIMRVCDRERLHAVNNLECDRLMERWTSPECIQAVTKFFQRDKH